MEEEMSAFFCPPHLLTLDKSCTEHLIDRRLYKTCCDFLSVPIPITIVRNEGVIGVDVRCWGAVEPITGLRMS